MIPNQPIYSSLVKTSLGIFQVIASDKGLVKVHFPGCHEPTFKKQQASLRIRKVLEHAKHYLRAYFSGRTCSIQDVLIDWSLFQPFERKVLRALTRIPAGTTTNYGFLAKCVGSQKAARAVGNVLNQNSIPIIIPCHRIVRKDGSMGGFGAGKRWKKRLLELEKSVR